MPKNEVTIDGFSQEMQKLFKEYGDQVTKIVSDEINDVAKETAKRLKRTSPKDKGDYAKGWTWKKEDSRLGPKAVVYNKTFGWLVHLIEKGHAKVNGGRTKAQPHVEPAEEWANKELFKRVKGKLSQ